MPPRERLGRLLSGPHLGLPAPLDAMAERWARLPPRGRMALVCLAVLGLAGAVQARVAQVERRWGGPPVQVLVAGTDAATGSEPEDVRTVALPPVAVPDGALREIPDGAVLAAGLPAGAVLTQGHFEAAGPLSGVASDLRALPIPVEEGWLVEAGGWVDVWVLDGGEGEAALVGRSRPVLDVTEGVAAEVALVALEQNEVAATTRGLAQGRVLLAHAPAP